MANIRRNQKKSSLHKKAEEDLTRANAEPEIRIKEHTAELSESEEKYRLLVDSANEIIVVFQEKIKFVNKRGLEITGYSETELLSRPFIDFIHPDDRDMISDRARKRTRGEAVLNAYQFRIIHKDGNTKWLNINAALIQWQGKPATLGMMSDITERKLVEESLRKSEEKYRNIVETTIEAISIVDAGARIVFVNGRWLEMFGYNQEEAIQMTLFDLVFPEDMAAMKGRWESCKEGIKATYEVRVRRKDGDPVWALTGVTPNFGPKGEFLGTLNMLADITDRKKAEETQRQQAQLLHLSYDAILVWRKDGSIEHWNKGAEQLYGYTESEAVGRVTHKLLKTIHPVPWQEIEAAMRKHGQWEGELRHYAKDGHELTVSARHQLMLGTDGIERILETNRNITERKLAESKARQLSAIVESSDDAIIGKTLDGVITSWNKGAENMYGYTEAEVIGKSISILAPADRKDEIPELLDRIKHGESIQNLETLRLKKDGNEIPTIISISPILDERGKIIGASTIAHDITDRKTMERALQDYAQRIIQVQEEERKRIAFELHDDTAQYLSILKLQLDSLINSGKIHSPEILKKLKYLEEDAGRAVDDVRRYSHELRPGVLEHLGLKAALEQMAEDVNKLHQIVIEINVEGTEPQISEQVKLGFFRIAQEALTNCRKHSKAPKANVSLKFQTNQLFMAVSDNGAGFNMQEATTRSKLKGSLGLMSMHERAKLIGANLTIESQPDRGTTVEVKMPL